MSETLWIRQARIQPGLHFIILQYRGHSVVDASHPLAGRGTIVKVGIGLPFEPVGLQKLYSPAIERNFPSRLAMLSGCFWPLGPTHS